MATRFDYYNTGDDSDRATVFGSSSLVEIFTATQVADITEVWLKLWRSGAVGVCRLCIEGVDGDGYPDGVRVVANTNKNLSDLPTTPQTAAWTKFELSETLRLEIGKQYALELINSSGTGGGEVHWRGDETSPTYTNGYALRSISGTSLWYGAFAPVTTIDKQVEADDDDTYLSDDQDDGETLVTGSVQMGGTRIIAHFHYSPGLRFINVGVPASDVIILSAYLTFTPNNTYGDSDIFVAVHGELADTGSFTTAADYVARTRTTAHAHYAGSKWWTKDVEEVVGCGLATVQEIVDNPAWLQGNAMTFLLAGSETDPGVERVAGYDHDTEPTKAVKLHIEFVPDGDKSGDFMFELWGPDSPVPQPPGSRPFGPLRPTDPTADAYGTHGDGLMNTVVGRSVSADVNFKPAIFRNPPPVIS